ncbi:Centriole, cilia and spindle-associated protein [Liparis tanakae]|uniref:Centriole, cilia and spindle-associated protein n=1 Tax=Liparis tanakae TaxID=230148 RepID=A0A4Z2H6P7_9TELE|nr:Centriole, cilia and spindle-associated protein [Liparis tanakae]
MVTRKIRSEYMKKFRDPKWETFSQSYEDSLKYRLTRRLLEHSHRPWFWESWEGSESSGRSTPRPAGNRIAPLAPPPPAEEGAGEREAPGAGSGAPGAGSGAPGEDGRAELRGGDAATTLPPPVVQTPRDSPKRGSVVERRRARSADLQQTSRLADDRWVTEYMRCFSARLR